MDRRSFLKGIGVLSAGLALRVKPIEGFPQNIVRCCIPAGRSSELLLDNLSPMLFELEAAQTWHLTPSEWSALPEGDRAEILAHERCIEIMRQTEVTYLLS